MVEIQRFREVNILLTLLDMPSAESASPLIERASSKISHLSKGSVFALARKYMRYNRPRAVGMLRGAIEVELVFLGHEEIIRLLEDNNPSLLENCLLRELKRRGDELRSEEMLVILSLLRTEAARLSFLAWIDRLSRIPLFELLAMRQLILHPLVSGGEGATEKELEIINEVIKRSLLIAQDEEVRDVFWQIIKNEVCCSDLPDFFIPLARKFYPYIQVVHAIIH